MSSEEFMQLFESGALGDDAEYFERLLLKRSFERFRLEAALEQHLRCIGADPKDPMPKQRTEAADWFVREMAFTHLNRLESIKSCFWSLNERPATT